MPARRDPEYEISHTVPRPPPMTPAERVSLGEVAAELMRELDRLLQETGYASNPKFRHCVHLARVIAQNFPASYLPGFAEHSKEVKQAKGSMEEIVSFCVTIGLEKRDGEWFFNKCEGCGWKNGGRSIHDWRATVRAWKEIQVFPSQKGAADNGSPAAMMVKQKEFDRIEKRMALIKNSYDSHQQVRPDDREELRKLAARKAELKKELGVVV